MESPRVPSPLQAGSPSGSRTQFLDSLCDHLVAIDMAERCIEACKQRFQNFAQVQYHVNDGRSLDMIPDHSIDLVFSFDSLVHADASVIDAYISQLPRILSNSGAAFLHHSNLGAYSRQISLITKVPKLQGMLGRLGVWDGNYHWRDSGVCARVIRGQAEKHGLVCASQEIVHWGTRRIKNDCFTTLVTKGSRYDASNPILINNRFMQESTFWRRSLWERTPGLECQFDLAADMRLWSRFFDYEILYGVKAPLGGFRLHTKNKSSDMKKYLEQAQIIIDNLCKRSPQFRNSTRRVARSLIRRTPIVRSRLRLYSIDNVIRTMPAEGDEWKIKKMMF